MPDKLFLDTNILVYLSDEESIFHKEVLKQFETLQRKYELWISRQVLREYAVVITRASVSEFLTDDLLDDLNKWGSFFHVADETEEVTEALKKLIKKYELKGKRIHDANIVATMIVNDISLICTVNENDFEKIEEISLLRIEH